MQKYGVLYHFYADDTQLYVSFSVNEQQDAASNLETCIAAIKEWMKNNFLKLNSAKTEFLVVSSQSNKNIFHDDIEILIGNSSISSAHSVRNIGATFDSHLLMKDHVNLLCRACYVHLRHIGSIRQFLTQDAAEKLVHAFVSSKLDYLNSLLVGLPKHLICNLQKIQNNAARIVKRTSKYESITPVLKLLHWLPVEKRIIFKMLLLTFKAINGTGPLYLSELLSKYRRCLRSSEGALLQEHTARSVRYGERAFYNCAPKLWNALPLQLRLCNNVTTFKKSLKTHLFKEAY